VAQGCRRVGAARRGRRTAPPRPDPRPLELIGEALQRFACPDPLHEGELREVGHRCRPEALQVAPGQRPQGIVSGIPVAGGQRDPGRHVRRPLAEGPRAAGDGMQQRRERPQRPPHALRIHPRALLEPGQDLGRRARTAGELQQVRHQCVGVCGGEAARRKACVAEPGAAQRRLHRSMHGGVVVRVHRVQRDPHQRRLDDLLLGEGRVEVGRVEDGQPVPQREVRRGGLLRLQRHHASDGVHDVECLPLQEQLAAERGPVEPAGGDLHADRRSFTSRAHATRRGAAARRRGSSHPHGRDRTTSRRAAGRTPWWRRRR
jgi:hypothetical protein